MGGFQEQRETITQTPASLLEFGPYHQSLRSSRSRSLPPSLPSQVDGKWSFASHDTSACGLAPQQEKTVGDKQGEHCARFNSGTQQQSGLGAWLGSQRAKRAVHVHSRISASRLCTTAPTLHSGAHHATSPPASQPLPGGNPTTHCLGF